MGRADAFSLTWADKHTVNPFFLYAFAPLFMVLCSRKDTGPKLLRNIALIRASCGEIQS